MPKRSSIHQLPEEILEFLNDELSKNSLSFDGLADIINQKLCNENLPLRISKSALHRYSVMRKRIMQSNASMEMMAKYMGSMPKGKAGRLMIELVRKLAYDASEDIYNRDDGVVIDLKSLANLSLIIQRMEKADEINAKRDIIVREQVLADAADEIEKIGAKQGLSKENMNLIRGGILGIKDNA